MRVLFDTSVLVASLVRSHTMHARAGSWHRKAMRGELEFLVSAHTLAELYSVLTSLPLRPRIQPPVALALVERNVRKPATVVFLDGQDYADVLGEVARLGLTGGAVYDAVIVHAARKGGADRLLTFNERHFRLAWPEGGDRIVVP